MDCDFENTQYKLACHDKNHEDQFIIGICTNRRCRQQRTLCQRCLPTIHSSCNKFIVFLDDLARQMPKIEEEDEMINQYFYSVMVELNRMQKLYNQRLKVFQEYNSLGNRTSLDAVCSILRCQKIDLGHMKQGIDQIMNIIWAYLNPVIPEDSYTPQGEKILKTIKLGDNCSQNLDYIFNIQEFSLQIQQGEDEQANLACHDKEHENQSVSAICINRKCIEQRTLCQKCIPKFHSQCNKFIVFLDDLQKQMPKINKEDDMINQYFNSVIADLTQMKELCNSRLKVFQKYDTLVNRTSLDAVCSILRCQKIDIDHIKDGIDQIKDIIQEYLNPVIPEQQLKNQQDQKRFNMTNLVDNFKISQNLDCTLNIKQLKPEEWIYQGDDLYQMKKLADAIRCYDAALRINPNHEDAFFKKGLALFDQNKFKEALECYEKTLKIDSDHDEAWCNKGKIFLEQKEFSKALQCQESALNINKKNIIALNFKGLAHFSLNQNEQAIECYNEALKIKPNYFEVLFNKGDFLSTQNQFEEAIGCYKAALKIRPKYVEALQKIGFAYCSLYKYEEAIYCYDEALKLNQNEVISWNGKGFVLFQSGKPQEAIKCYDKAIEIDPNYYTALCNKGNSLCVLGDFDQGIKYFEDALKINPQYSLAYFNKGHALHQQNKFEEALKCYDSALQFKEDMDEVWLHKGNALTDLHKLKEAINCYDIAIELSSNSPHAYYQKAIILQRQKKFKEADKCLRKTYEIDQNYKDILKRMNDIKDKLQNQ